MSTLLEIKAASEALPPDQQDELIRFLTARLGPTGEPVRQARLVPGAAGTLLLEAPPGAPRIP